MASRGSDRRRHIILTETSQSEAFTSPAAGGGGLKTLPVDRARHGSELRRLLDKARAELARRAQKVRPVGIEAPKGFYLEFESPPGFELKLESLDSKKNGVELVAVRNVDRSMLATVYVPQGRIGYFISKSDGGANGRR